MQLISSKLNKVVEQRIKHEKYLGWLSLLSDRPSRIDWMASILVGYDRAVENRLQEMKDSITSKILLQTTWNISERHTYEVDVDHARTMDYSSRLVYDLRIF